MLTSKLVITASLLLAATGALADSGDLTIDEWSSVSFTVSRQQVQAELREATRLGLISIGESDTPVATAEQLFQIARAGQEAGEQLAQAPGEGEG